MVSIENVMIVQYMRAAVARCRSAVKHADVFPMKCEMHAVNMLKSVF